ncbi:hypothetical protein IPM09_00820 [Candidatus Saccharibacteria bacterium]|nr:MAG: hypothetical protein IPM09_00820 [Candidatus Saccharibacteria bacterium]
MQKDVIYIDVDDDITAIIGKVKAAKAHIVALVPPKRIGAIQSAVNLKLVHRAAEQADKRLVIISNNVSLMALAGSAGIPVARNLQSKPELAEVPVLEVDDDDVIDGADLPVGDHQAVAEKVANDSVVPEVGAAAVAASADSVAVSHRDKPVTRGSKVAVPNFDVFRKKLLLGIVGGVTLISLLVWAFVFAPSARIIITARTTDAALNSRVSLSPTATTDLKAGTIASVLKSTKKDVSIPFTATGKKDVGDKATGAVKLYNDSFDPVTVSGSVTAGGFTFYLSSAVTVPKGSCTRPSSCSSGTATGTIVAAAPGSNYNGISGELGDLPGTITGAITGATANGTDKTVTVVSQEDVDKVSGDASKQDVAEAAKKELLASLRGDYIILDSTFKADTSAVKSAPAVGSEATDSKATLAGSVTYTIVATVKSEVSKYLDAYFAQQIDGKTDQKVYSNGLTDVSFTNISQADTITTVNISTNGKIGPKVDEKALKEFAKGKRYGEIQDYVKQVSGIDNVDVKFSPFWVSSSPGDPNRIKVEFKVNGA